MKKSRLILFWFLAIFLAVIRQGLAAPLPVLSFARNAHGVILKLNQGALRFEVFSSRVIRVTYAPGEALPTNRSLCVLQKAGRIWWKVAETKKNIVLSTKELDARVSRETGAVSFFDDHGGHWA